VEAVFDLEQRLWIIPDLAVAGLPFGMLLCNPPARNIYYPGDPDTDYAASLLLQRYAVVIGPSAWLSGAAPAEKPETSREIAVFANPYSLDTRQGPSYKLAVNQTLRYFEPLNYAGDEADSIRGYFPDAQIFKYERANLSLLEKISGEASILHFASHAIIDAEFGAFSGLMLYPEKEDPHDDGLLYGYKIADLTLNCDLVCLSACATARGEAIRGEGMMGMPRLFLAAGARRVLMTRWVVSDRYNATFMPLFYKSFLTAYQTKAAALRAAKLAMLSRRDREGRFSYAHPFFWAGLTLYGEPDIRVESSFMPALLPGLLVAVLLAALLLWWFRRRRTV
jgi:CHAT domain-containing protein